MNEVDVVIIGSGFGGIGMAIEVSRHELGSYVLLEKSDSLGGTWRDNTYPGAACDVKATLYHFSFAPWTWSRAYPQQNEILRYMERVADEFGVAPHVRYNSAVVSATWDDVTSRWTTTCANGDVYTSRYLVSGTGQLNRPHVPTFEGARDFRGAQFHTARFDHTVSLDGARVAVVGSGASAIQVVPAIADTVSALDIYQRSAPYVMPKEDPPTTLRQRVVQRVLPSATLMSRVRAYVFGELFGAGLVGKRGVRAKARQQWEMYVNAVVRDPELRLAIEPDYEIGCKRVLLASDWYPTLQRPHVSLVTEPIQRFTGDGIVTTDGVERAYDLVIYATGFDATNFLAPIDIRGRDGGSLHDAWGSRPLAHRGVTVPGFPNFFILYGPNTNLGSNSILFMLESQFTYIRQILTAARDAGWPAVEVTPAAFEEWRRTIDGASSETAWLQGCQSWYTRDGVNTNNWPFSSWRYHRLLRTWDPENYQPASGNLPRRTEETSVFAETP